jgi:formylglycine-generating enzyme required for sulfatase activity
LCICCILQLCCIVAYAQDRDPEEPDLGLDTPITASDSTSTADTAESQRRVQRLGDVEDDSEWDMELNVPNMASGDFPQVRLLNAKQNQRLQQLLSEISTNPGDSAALQQLNAFLGELLGQANDFIGQNNLYDADVLLSVIESIDPNKQGVSVARQRIQSMGEIEGQLAAAWIAMKEGRVDQPETNSAWFFYRQALDQDPENNQAREGLIAVQEDMIARALASARELDFDSAEAMLEDAYYVRDSTELVDQARLEINGFRTERAQQLETAAVAAMDAGEFESAERVMIELIALGGAESMVAQLRSRMEEARIYGGFNPGQVIRDHFASQGQWTPETVVISAGSFMMGSSAFEEGRAESEGPQHRVTFRRGFAIGRREVSVEEFRIFVKATGYMTEAERKGWSTIYDHRSGRLAKQDDVNWRKNYEGQPADDDDPVIHVSWNDAKEYVKWLARGTAKPYRLPNEAEFEYALRGGGSKLYWWGDGSPSRVVENLTGGGDVSRSRRRWSVAFENYKDQHWGPAQVASFETNPYGLYDIAGNVAEWVNDCWHDTYVRAPTDGSPPTTHAPPSDFPHLPTITGPRLDSESPGICNMRGRLRHQSRSSIRFRID